MRQETYKLIAEWLYHNDKMKEINKYLFNHTELFEEIYCSDFNNDIFRFFAGKITRYAKDVNEIYKRLNKEQTNELNKERILLR